MDQPVHPVAVGEQGRPDRRPDDHHHCCEEPRSHRVREEHVEHVRDESTWSSVEAGARTDHGAEQRRDDEPECGVTVRAALRRPL
jgi:hypothetical protein